MPSKNFLSFIFIVIDDKWWQFPRTAYFYFFDEKHKYYIFSCLLCQMRKSEHYILLFNKKVSEKGNERIEESPKGIRGNLFVSLLTCNALFREVPSHIARCIFLFCNCKYCGCGWSHMPFFGSHIRNIDAKNTFCLNF